MIEGVGRPDKPPEDASGHQVMIGARLRYAVRFVVNVKRARDVSGEIAGIRVAPSEPDPDAAPDADGKFRVQLLFRNTGNAYVKPIGYVDIRDTDGQSVLQQEIEAFYVFPDRSLWVSVAIDRKLDPGPYLALAVLDYGADNLVAGEVRFTLPLVPAAQATPGGGTE